MQGDYLLDRIELKSSLSKWRNGCIGLAVLCVIILCVSLIAPETWKTSDDHVARIKVSGPIFDSAQRAEILEEIRENKQIKAIILHIDSPGGTMSGSEAFYESLMKIKSEKPIIAVFGSVAASGGYMVAMASDHIITRRSTITGSIGVIMQTAEFTSLANKMGIEFITLKSGELKGNPSPFEKMSEEAKMALNATIADSFDLFVDIVAKGRNMPRTQVLPLADGRIFTGRQALADGLVDAFGDEQDALNWLEKHHEMDADIEVVDYRLRKPKHPLKDAFEGVANFMHRATLPSKGSGLQTIWSF